MKLGFFFKGSKKSSGVCQVAEARTTLLFLQRLLIPHESTSVNISPQCRSEHPEHLPARALYEVRLKVLNYKI